MKTHSVRVHSSADNLPREAQLAWHIAAFAADVGPLSDDVRDMIACRIVDNASVALAAINRAPVAAARAMALAHAHHLTSIAFPAISTGVYRFPAVAASRIAVGAVIGSLAAAPSVAQVIFCCFSDDSAQLHRQALLDADPCAT